MRKKKLVLILLVLSILFLLIGCVAWGNTNANLDKLNSLQFTDCAEGDSLSYRTESGIEINLHFGEHSVKYSIGVVRPWLAYQRFKKLRDYNTQKQVIVS